MLFACYTVLCVLLGANGLILRRLSGIDCAKYGHGWQPDTPILHQKCDTLHGKHKDLGRARVNPEAADGFPNTLERWRHRQYHPKQSGSL